MKSVKILAPCGILGYGYPLASFEAGLLQNPDAIVVDAGSTDAGPHKLGAGVAIVSDKACEKDLEPMITQGFKRKIPVIIGSAGGSGAKKHVEWTCGIIKSIIKKHNMQKVRLVIVWADIPADAVAKAMNNKQLQPLDMAVPELTSERLEKTTRIVAQMGHEPIVDALNLGADIIVCGRAYDPAPFAAFCAWKNMDIAMAYHMGKILECAALCAEPGTTKDCIMGTLYEDSFVISPLSQQRRCTPLSVAAHTFYEKSHPYLLQGPGWLLNLENCQFTQEADGCSVRVKGSQIIKSDVYYIKLEGALQAAYRTFVIAGIRDPLMIERLEEIEENAKEQIAAYYPEYKDYVIRFINYGLNGVMGALEPMCKQKNNAPPYEIGLLMDVMAPTQEMADAICASLRSTMLHYGYKGRKSTAGNLAFPFAPSDVCFGAVYEFSLYHLMPVDSPEQYFPIEVRLMP